jgi:hypothetical protein
VGGVINNILAVLEKYGVGLFIAQEALSKFKER